MATVQEAIRRLTVESTTRGVSETTEKLKAMGHAHTGVTVASQSTERATVGLERRMESLQRRLDVNYRREQDMARATRELTAARQIGLITLDRQNELLALQAGNYNRAAAGARSYGAAVTGGLAGLAGGLGVGLGISGLLQIPRMIGDIVDEAGNLVDTADKIGITTKALQELKFAAGQSGIQFEDLTSGLSFFNKNVGEASRGAGDLYEIFKANGVALRDQAGALRPVVDLVGDFADLVKNAGSGQERATLITKAFGRSNDELINTFSNGKVGLRAYADEADRTGQIIDDALVRRAEEIGDEWEKFTGQLSTGWKGFVLSVVTGTPTAIDSINSLRVAVHNWLVEMTGIGERFADFNEMNKSVVDLLGGGGSQAGVGTLMTGVDFSGRFEPPSNRRTIVPGKASADAQKEAERLRKQYDDALKAADKQTAALRAQAGALGLGVGAAAEYVKQQELLNLAVVNHIELSAAETAEIDRVARAYGSATLKLAEMTKLRDLVFERSQLGRSPIEQQVASATRAIYGDDYERQMDGAVAGQIRLNEQIKLASDLGKDFASGFLSDLANGVSAMDALGNALGRLEQKLLDMALNQAINALFANLLGAVGGGVLPGGISLGQGGIGHAHTGGVVGSTGFPQSYVHPAYFDNAPRMHRGGMIGMDEVPIVAKRGEEIGWPSQLAAKYGGNSGSVNVVVNNAPAGTSANASTRRRDDGGMDILIDLIEGRLAAKVASGRSALPGAMEQVFGLSRARAAR